VGAARALQSLLARDAQALSAQALGPVHAAVVAEVLVGAEAALARGDEASARALAGIAQRMAPAGAAAQADLRAIIGALTASSVQQAAGPPAAARPGAQGSGWLLRVRPGDTLWGLAARFLGDGRRWTEVWRAQQARADLGQGVPLPDPDRLRVGQAIWLPRDDPGGAAGLSLRVLPGDSLWRIAERVYGDGRRWPLIAEANGLADPDRLVVGQRLVVRPAP
jgi:nucleoid-associated protein YgaU